MIVDPTNLKPRAARSFDRASEAGVVAGMSPSRASDFMTCPLLYRFRVIDRIPEPPTPATARGTLVHAVLERLFDRPPAERTPAVAAEMLEPEWVRLCEGDAGLAALFSEAEQRGQFITDAHAARTVEPPLAPHDPDAGTLQPLHVGVVAPVVRRLLVDPGRDRAPVRPHVGLAGEPRHPAGLSEGVGRADHHLAGDAAEERTFTAHQVPLDPDDREPCLGQLLGGVLAARPEAEHHHVHVVCAHGRPACRTMGR